MGSVNDVLACSSCNGVVASMCGGWISVRGAPLLLRGGMLLGSAVRCHSTEVRLVLGPFYLMASRRVCPSDERIEVCRIEPLCAVTV